MKQNKLLSISIILLIIILGIAGYFIFKKISPGSDNRACTLEAKICPDGSTVGRTGPNCEFAVCPTSTSDETGNKVSECLAKTICKGNVPCMANPASVFCTCMGGTEKIVNSAEGQSGVCQINGKEIDEWEYFRSFSAQ